MMEVGVGAADSITGGPLGLSSSVTNVWNVDGLVPAILPTVNCTVYSVYGCRSVTVVKLVRDE